MPGTYVKQGFSDRTVAPWMEVLSPLPAPPAIVVVPTIVNPTATWGGPANFFDDAADDFARRAADIQTVYLDDDASPPIELRGLFFQSDRFQYGAIFAGTYSLMQFTGPDILGENAAQLDAVAEWAKGSSVAINYPNAGQVFDDELGDYRPPRVVFEFRLQHPDDYPGDPA